MYVVHATDSVALQTQKFVWLVGLLARVDAKMMCTTHATMTLESAERPVRVFGILHLFALYVLCL